MDVSKGHCSKCCKLKNNTLSKSYKFKGAFETESDPVMLGRKPLLNMQ
jgi:hypothetical protein